MGEQKDWKGPGMLLREWDPQQAESQSRRWRKPGNGGLLVMREDLHMRFGVGGTRSHSVHLELRFIAGIVMGGRRVR